MSIFEVLHIFHIFFISPSNRYEVEIYEISTLSLKNEWRASISYIESTPALLTVQLSFTFRASTHLFLLSTKKKKKKKACWCFALNLQISVVRMNIFSFIYLPNFPPLPPHQDLLLCYLPSSLTLKLGGNFNLALSLSPTTIMKVCWFFSLSLVVPCAGLPHYSLR